jgi:glycerol-3-phosphate acyltransferase PlsY
MPDPINWQLAAPLFVMALLFGYLIGSVPFGLILTRMAGMGDIRAIGSGNIGATNVLRTGNKKLAAGTLVLDALKGTAAVLIAGYYGPDAAGLAGLGAFLGHLFPVWLKFKGGKGVATFLGVCLGLFWPAALVFAVVWLLTAFISRLSSLAALLGTLAVPVAMYFIFFDLRLMELTGVMAALSWFAHRENIGRLLRGQESRIGQKGSSAHAPDPGNQ